MTKGRIVALCGMVVACLATLAHPSWAQGAGGMDGLERIISFDSHIVVGTDGALTVTERIQVAARGIQIRRGIFRDFPTRYRSRHGGTVQVGFDILSVERDGASERYRTESLSNGVRVYIGREDVFLQPGTYTYTIRYRATRMIGFFETFDELYWNVTGNGWSFPIERATAVVELPGGAGIVQRAGYTGRTGAQGRNYEILREAPGRIEFATTRPLFSREGLTVAVAWPKGVVSPPAGVTRLWYFVSDNLASVIAGLGLLVVLIYYLIAWIIVGRDPSRGTIIPRFEPPKGFSPAASRFLMRMGFDQKCFAAALVSMAVKGYLSITEDKAKSYTLKRERTSQEGLSPGERAIAGALFPRSGTIELKQKNHARIRGAINALRAALTTDFEVGYFLRNQREFLIGLGLSALATIATAVTMEEEEGVFVFWIGMIVLFEVFLLRHVVSSFLARRFLSGGLMLVPALFLLLLLTGTFAFLIEGDSVAPALMLGALGLVNVLFFHLIKAPTADGRRVMDEIEGLKMYLSVAEKDRLNLLNPPERTPEQFEKFLPYALALDVENRWAEQFKDVLERASADGGTYHPNWYSGVRLATFSSDRFATSLGSSLSGAVASSSTAPGSSSGSGGGGSSGGGGGGGGGGGW